MIRCGDGFRDCFLHAVEGAPSRAGGGEGRHREPGEQASARCVGERIGNSIERERDAADQLIDHHAGYGAQQAAENGAEARRRSPSPIPNAAPPAAPIKDQLPRSSNIARIRSLLSGVTFLK